MARFSFSFGQRWRHSPGKGRHGDVINSQSADFIRLKVAMKTIWKKKPHSLSGASMNGGKRMRQLTLRCYDVIDLPPPLCPPSPPLIMEDSAKRAALGWLWLCHRRPSCLDLFWLQGVFGSLSSGKWIASPRSMTGGLRPKCSSNIKRERERVQIQILIIIIWNINEYFNGLISILIHGSFPTWLSTNLHIEHFHSAPSAVNCWLKLLTDCSSLTLLKGRPDHRRVEDPPPSTRIVKDRSAMADIRPTRGLNQTNGIQWKKSR